MDFTLKYAGSLVSDKSKWGSRAKHDLRKLFDAQLQPLWAEHPYLRTLKPQQFQVPFPEGDHFQVVRPIENRGLLWRLPLGGYNFVPLVTHIHEVHCHLAIRLHRPLGGGGIIYSGGDLDNRLRIVFDALSIPKQVGELTDVKAVESPDQGEVFFCLLEDDRYITKMSIESFRLLRPPSSADENYVEMDIDVHLDPVTSMWANIPMLFR